MEPALREVKICDRWPLLLPEHRAARGEAWLWWEKPRLESMFHNLHQGDVIYDIGTEEGDLSALFAQWCGEIVLVEPNPRVWPNVKAIFEANGLPAPAGAFVGFAGPERHGLQEAWTKAWPDCADGEIIGDHGFLNLCERPEVQVTTIDTMALWHATPTAITMDIEGAELLALRGAGKTLSEAKPLVWVSIHPDFSLDMYGTTRQDVLDLMGSHGYRYEHLAAEHEHHVFFWHPDRHDPVLPYGHR